MKVVTFEYIIILLTVCDFCGYLKSNSDRQKQKLWSKELLEFLQLRLIFFQILFDRVETMNILNHELCAYLLFYINKCSFPNKLCGRTGAPRVCTISSEFQLRSVHFHGFEHILMTSLLFISYNVFEYEIINIFKYSLFKKISCNNPVFCTSTHTLLQSDFNSNNVRNLHGPTLSGCSLRTYSSGMVNWTTFAFPFSKPIFEFRFLQMTVKLLDLVSCRILTCMFHIIFCSKGTSLSFISCHQSALRVTSESGQHPSVAVVCYTISCTCHDHFKSYFA